MARRTVIRFLTDANVPDSVGNYLAGRGHDVVRVRDIMAKDAKDPVVAEAALTARRVLITWDRDFNHQRFMQPRHAQLSRIGFSCSEPEGASRIEALIEYVEFAYERAAGGRMLIRISRDKFQITE